MYACGNNQKLECYQNKNFSLTSFLVRNAGSECDLCAVPYKEWKESLVLQRRLNQATETWRNILRIQTIEKQDFNKFEKKFENSLFERESLKLNDLGVKREQNIHYFLKLFINLKS